MRSGYEAIQRSKGTRWRTKRQSRPRARGATRLPYEESFASLAHINRTTTDTKWQECKEWFIEQCEGHKAYQLVPTQRVDKEPARPPKRIEARSYQLKTDHTRIGP